MNLRKVRAALAFSVVLGAGLAFEGSVAAQQPEVPPATEPSVNVDLTVRAESQMTGPQMLTWVEEQTAVARQAKISVQNLLDQSRRDKDIIKTNALNDLLTQINVNIRGIEERTDALKIAIQANDQAAAAQQVSILKVYFSRIQSLVAEAQNCVGASDVVLGESETTMTIEDDVTSEDPSSDLGGDPIGADPTDQPPHRSGYY